MTTLFVIPSPCLPGSVVGATSMEADGAGDNVTEVAAVRGVPDMYPRWLLLFGGHHGVGDGMHGKRDAVLHPDFAHQFSHVRLDGALLDA